MDLNFDVTPILTGLGNDIRRADTLDAVGGSDRVQFMIRLTA
jgi:hypothetical protein